MSENPNLLDDRLAYGSSGYPPGKIPPSADRSVEKKPKAKVGNDFWLVDFE
jgi:hypothetical protein